MRVALAAVFQLTNTFSRQATTRQSFVVDRFDVGSRQVFDPFNVERFVNALVDSAQTFGTQAVPLLSAQARSAGPMTADCSEWLSELLSTSLSENDQHCDAVILILSGAACGERFQSVDLELIQAARESVGNGVPVIAVVSTLANLSDELVSAPDLLLGFNTQEVDSFDSVARKTIGAVRGLVAQEIHPAVKAQHLPLLVPLAAQNARREPMSSLIQLGQEFESQAGVIDASLFPGFPYADSSQTGFSVLVSGEGDQVDALAQRLQRAVWDRREELVPALPLNVETVVHEAMLRDAGPVVIADAGDDPKYGGAGDGTGLLWALIDLGTQDAALGIIVDRICVEQAIETGVGNRVQIDIGGSIDRRAGYPINVTAQVRRISDGVVAYEGIREVDCGRTAVLDVEGRHGGRIEVIVTEKSPLVVDIDVFQAVGIDLSRKKVVGVKSSSRLREHFGSVSGTILETSTPGITTPVLAHFDYRRIRQPTFPLDPM